MTNFLDPSIFADLEAKIEEESSIRDALTVIVHRLDRAVATTSGLLSRVHSTPRSQYPPLVKTVEEAVHAQAAIIKDLDSLASQHPFYKYNHKWTRSIQAAIYTTLYCAWLGGFPPTPPESSTSEAPPESSTTPSPEAATVGTLLSLPQLGTILNAATPSPNNKDTFHLTTEEYLLALTDLTTDLSRLATNAVTIGDFQLPMLISGFVKDLLAGFQLLNLKNDVLRRKADVVKYDVKRVEDVVYDLSLRGLVARPGME